MRRWSTCLLDLIALLGVFTLAACGGGGDAPSKADAPTDGREGATGVTAAPLDQTSFCVAIRALEALGSADATAAGTPAEVLAQNSRLAELIDEAAANAPADAPADVQHLVDDYVVLSDAIAAAGGDSEAAMATLRTEEPELVARFSRADAHKEAFTFFAERCGTAPPS